MYTENTDRQWISFAFKIQTLYHGVDWFSSQTRVHSSTKRQYYKAHKQLDSNIDSNSRYLIRGSFESKISNPSITYFSSWIHIKILFFLSVKWYTFYHDLYILSIFSFVFYPSLFFLGRESSDQTSRSFLDGQNNTNRPISS